MRIILNTTAEYPGKASEAIIVSEGGNKNWCLKLKNLAWR
jgi:hypothetical protein